MKWNRIVVLCIFALGCLSASLLMGQTGGGSVVGSVHDQSGAVVPKADVTLTDIETGTTLTTKTLPTGEYLFPVVPVGIYTETVNAPGFAQTQHEGLIVPLNKIVTADIALQVGSATSTVQVQALTSQLETQTSQAATTIDQQTVDDLPIELNGSARSPTGLADLMPGVSDTQGNGYGSTGPQAQSYSETINGGQSWIGSMVYDGIPMVTVGIPGDYRQQPVPVEALQEFSLVQNNFSPEFGRTPGGSLTFSTRAGTNAYHGQAYEFLRNDDFDAAGYFATSKPPLHQNEFGVNVGGPVILPHLYNGHNKLFFFAFYSGFRVSEGVTPNLITVPTMAERTGDFTGLVNGSGQQTPIYDPSTTSCNAVTGVCTRQQYQYNGILNVIPPSDLSAAGQAFTKYIPQPQNSSTVLNYSASGTDGTVENRFGGRIDYNLGTKDEMHGFFSMGPLTSNFAYAWWLPPINSSAANIGSNQLALVRLGEDHTFSPNLLLHVGFGFNRDTSDSTPPNNNADINFGIPNALPGVTPSVTLGPLYQNTEGSGGSDGAEYAFIENGFLSWTRGKQQFKIGAEFDKFGGNDRTNDSEYIQFNDLGTGYPGNAASGDVYASMLSGVVQTAGLSVSPYSLDSRFKYFAAYFNDDYKVLPNLVLNMGIRYEIPWTRSVVNNVFSSFLPNYPNPGAGGIDGALVFAGDGPYSCHCTRFAHTRFVLWQPRFGLAYKLDDKTVVHAGYGIFISANLDTEAGLADGFNANTSWTSENSGITPAIYTAVGYPSFTPPPFISPSYDNNAGISEDPPFAGLPGVIQNYTLNVQRQLPAGFLLDLGYVGNTSKHIASDLLYPNQIPIGYTQEYGDAALNSLLSSSTGQATGVPLPYPGYTGTVARALSAFPQYIGVNVDIQNGGTSSYNSLQARLQRQFRNGFSMLASYTWGRIFTDAEAGWGVGNNGPQDAFNPGAEVSPSFTEAPQTFVVSYVYNLPFGYNRKYLNHGIAASLLGGWGVSGIHHYQTGVPEFEESAEDNLPIGNFYVRPQIVPGQRYRGTWTGKFNPNTDFYVNPNSLTQPAPDTFGNAPRELPLRSLGLYTEDLSARKDFHIWESTNFQFRTDFFQAFNRTNFFATNEVGMYYPSIAANFGTLNAQGTEPRSIQFALKVLF